LKEKYRVSLEERSISCEARVSVILSKIVYIYMYPIPNGFRGRDISVYSSKIIITKRYYVLFLMPVFIDEVIKLVQFT
jgi:hypothetical protein